MIILNPAQQKDYLDSLVEVTLDNFSMTWRLMDVLITYGAANLPKPRATVLLRGEGKPVEIPGTNCGFFVSPVVNMAVLDCRRSLEFFGLTCDHKGGHLIPIAPRRQDDLGIENFGLARVSPADFLKAVSTVTSVPVEPVLIQVHNWSNKQLAHFTLSEPTVSMQSIRYMSFVMIEAYVQLLFTPLGLTRPQMNPVL